MNTLDSFVIYPNSIKKNRETFQLGRFPDDM